MIYAYWNHILSISVIFIPSCVRLRMKNDEEQRQIQDADREQHHLDAASESG